MKKVILGLYGALLISTCISNGYAATKHTTDKINQPHNSADDWLKKTVAVVRILNKLETHTDIVKIPVGQSVRYKSLTIEAQNCLVRPPSLPIDSAAFLQITDVKLTSLHFSAWVLASEPAASVFEHPLYSISVVGCTGGANYDVSEDKNDSTIASQKKSADQSSDSLEKSLEHSLQSQP